jgi:hypothetical protein
MFVELPIHEHAAELKAPFLLNIRANPHCDNKWSTEQLLPATSASHMTAQMQVPRDTM